MTVLKWGLIGAGDIAQKRVAPALRDSPACDLVAISRSRPELAESFAKAYGARRWHATWQDLLADPDVEAVYVATPVHLHAEHTIAAAGAGKHVLCEKPMAMNPADCDRMIAACRANGVKLGVAYYRHFYPVVARVKQIVASGEIGDPVIAQMHAFEWFNPQPDQLRALRRTGLTGERAERIADGILASLRGTSSQEGEVRYPGERTLEVRKRNLEDGIPVEPSIWDQVMSLAAP